MVPTNCFEGRNGDTEVENGWTCGHSGRGREWDEWRKVQSTHIGWRAGEKLLCSTGSAVWCPVRT